MSTVDANIFCLRSSQEEALYQDSAPNSKYRETPTGFWGIVSNIMTEWPHDIKSTVPYPNELPYPAVLESLSCGHLLLPGLRRHKCLSCEEQPPWGLYPGVHRNRWYGQARRTSCAAGRWRPPWPGEIHYSDVIWVSWRPKSISVRRFVQWLMLADIKKNQRSASLALFEVNPPVSTGFQGASNAEGLSMAWRFMHIMIETVRLVRWGRHKVVAICRQHFQRYFHV